MFKQPVCLFILLCVLSITYSQANDEKLSLGSKGPGGGLIFFIDNSGAHGLAAKAEDVKIGELNRLKWNDAQAAISAYGAEWRLPTKDELNLLYQQKDVVGGFTNDFYWNATEYGSGHAWYQYFINGIQMYSKKEFALRVRAVRDF